MDIPYTVQPRPDTGLYNAKVGIWLFLASEVMLFGALFSAYILLRVGAPEGYWPHGWLNVPIGTVNTLVLITSSITTVMAWASLEDEPVRPVQGVPRLHPPVRADLRLHQVLRIPRQVHALRNHPEGRPHSPTATWLRTD